MTEGTVNCVVEKVGIVNLVVENVGMVNFEVENVGNVNFEVEKVEIVNLFVEKVGIVNLSVVNDGIVTEGIVGTVNRVVLLGFGFLVVWVGFDREEKVGTVIDGRVGTVNDDPDGIEGSVGKVNFSTRFDKAKPTICYIKAI